MTATQKSLLTFTSQNAPVPTPPCAVGWICLPRHLAETRLYIRTWTRLHNTLHDDLHHHALGTYPCCYISALLPFHRWITFHSINPAISTRVPQEFLNQAVPRSTGALTSFPLDRQIKNDNSQHKDSRPVWTNQNHTYFLVRLAQNKFFGVPQNFSSQLVRAVTRERLSRGVNMLVCDSVFIVVDSTTVSSFCCFAELLWKFVVFFWDHTISFLTGIIWDWNCLV